MFLCFHHAIRKLLKTGARLADHPPLIRMEPSAGCLWNARDWLVNASGCSGDAKGRPPIWRAANRF